MTAPSNAFADPSAEEIMAASNDAMSKPIRFESAFGDVRMVVYQKSLPDGSLASLSEFKGPIDKIDIEYGDKSYDLFPSLRLAIDKHLILQQTLQQARSIASQLKGGAAEPPRLVGTVTYQGKECYELELLSKPSAVAAFARAFPDVSGGSLPVKTRLLIEKETYLMVLRETRAADGALQSRLEYKEITSQPDLTDEFFQLPAGIEIKTPTSLAEYVSIMTDAVSPPAGPPVIRPAVPVFKELPKHVVMKPRRKSPEEIRRSHAGGVAPASIGRWRWVALSCNVAILVILTMLVILRQVKKMRAKTV